MGGQQEPTPSAEVDPTSATVAPGAPPAIGTVLPAPKPTWLILLEGTARKVADNLWPLLLVHLTCDAAIFSLHRLSHRLTNELAVQFLGSGAVSPAAVGNMWYLSADPAIANFQTGYQPLTMAIFLAAFPLNVLLKTLAATATILICKDDTGGGIALPWWRPLAGLQAALPVVRSLWASVAALWRPVFVVELLVAAAVVPLQAASLAVVTLPITLPLILSLQAAAPAAVLEGARGVEAIKRSHRLLRPLRWALAVPFVGLVVAQRLVEAGKGSLFTAMPPRYYRELIELPIGLMVGGAVLAVVLARLQDVLPFVAYEAATQRERDGDGSTGGGGRGVRL